MQSEERLAGIGIPKDSILNYETQLKADKFVLVCHGTAAEMEKAKATLASTESRAGRPACRGSVVTQMAGRFP